MNQNPNNVNIITPKVKNISWSHGDPLPLDLNFSFLINEPEPIDFNRYFLQFENTAVDWLSGPLNPYLPSNLISLNFQNLDHLPAGNYIAFLYIEPSNSSGYIGQQTLAQINLVVTGSGTPLISTDKSVYNVVFNRSDNSISGDVAVSVLNNSDAVILDFFQDQIVFEPKQGFINGFNLEDNPLSEIQNNSTLPNTGVIDLHCQLRNAASQYISGFIIRLVIIDANQITVDPISLYFEPIMGVQELMKILKIINPFGIPFTLEAPSWLSLSVASGNSSIDLMVVTNTIGLLPGTYSGVIRLSFSGSFIDIPVVLFLKTFINTDIELYDFCLDISPIKFVKTSSNAVFVKTKFNATYYVMGVQTTVEKEYIVPYIKSEAYFELGEKAHGLFPRYKESLFGISNNTMFMKAIEINLTFEELNSDYELLKSESLNGIALFPGSKSKKHPILTNFGQRKQNHKSQFLFSVIDNNKVFLKKDNLITSGSKSIFTYLWQSIDMHHFQDGFQTIHIIWENQNFVPEWFTFTGKHSINIDFSHIYEKDIFKTLNSKYETSDFKILNINSGFLLEKERDLIKELIESRLVFIKIEDKIYRSFAITSKMVLENSDDELNAFDLEFLIVGKNGN